MYVVLPLRYDNFYNLQTYAKTTFKNFKTAMDGNRINWLKVKVLKVEKDNPEQILVKYDFAATNFICINPFPYTPNLQQTTLNIFCQIMEHLYN